MGSGMAVHHAGLKELFKFFIAYARITDDVAHRNCVNGIMAWNRNDPIAIGHYDVLALTCNPKTQFFQSLNRLQVVDSS
jgi:hypothetical protein